MYCMYMRTYIDTSIHISIVMSESANFNMSVYVRMSSNVATYVVLL